MEQNLENGLVIPAELREVDVQLGDDRGVGHVRDVRSGCGYEDD